ncbi:MAG: peptidoglycan binding protein CsiV [Gammaproteobacteria bacterium]|nr:peptidoglycan binding protein CsiV [Gammaproteobacteria bacterium]
MKKTIIAALSLLIFSFSVRSYALDYTDLNAYEIEVIIFKFNDTQAAGSEIWPDLVTTEAVENSIELHNNYSMTLTPGLDNMAYYYSKIPVEKFRLSKEAEQLNKSDEYEILYHSAWIQPGLDKEKAEFIHIKSQQADSVISAVDSLSAGDNPVLAEMQSFLNPGKDTAAENTRLDGVVKVELGRYLHIYFDLKYQRDLAANQSVLNTKSLNNYKDIKYYPIQNHRRMRSKEVHFIDHPLIGILVLATPFVLPEKNETTEQPLMKLHELPVKH